MSPERWQRLMAALEAPPSLDTYDSLAGAYAEAHRHYHTAVHIQDCLDQLDTARSLARSPKEVELALWFHDAVYKPTSAKNELASAEWAGRFPKSIGADEARCARVYSHILATMHRAAVLEGDAALVADIDLSILGQLPDKYAEFEGNVRKEYRWVPQPLYRTKRRRILESFLERPSIYATEHFALRFEARARKNLKSAIEKLRH